MGWQFIYYSNSIQSLPTSKRRFLKTTMGREFKFEKMSILQRKNRTGGLKSCEYEGLGDQVYTERNEEKNESNHFHLSFHVLELFKDFFTGSIQKYTIKLFYSFIVFYKAILLLEIINILVTLLSASLHTLALLEVCHQDDVNGIFLVSSQVLSLAFIES